MDRNSQTRRAHTEFGQAKITVPGARVDVFSWTDSSGNIWLFGGDGFDSSGASPGALNDLWKYNITANQWTWVGGSSTADERNWGIEGTASSGNIPGGRYFGTHWTDASGNFWLFGGYGLDTVGTTTDSLNDLWKFNPTSSQWTWVSGTSSIDQPGTLQDAGHSFSG